MDNLEFIRNIDAEGVSLYMVKKGFGKFKTNRSGIDVYLEPNNSDGFKIYLANNKSAPDYFQKIYEAIKILAEIENIDSRLIIQKIKSLDYDLHNYKIDVDKSDSVSILLLNELIESAKHAIRESAKIEHSQVYYKLTQRQKEKEHNPSDESNLFLKDCKFGHTWKGSFGVTIEVPLWLPTIGLFSGNTPDTLGRKATKRILNAFELVEKAEEKNSYNYILDTITSEDDILIISRFPELNEHLGHGQINLFVEFSPQIIVAGEIQNMGSKVISHRSLFLVDKAIEHLRAKDEDKDIEIIGFPETISSSKKDLLEDLLNSDRKVVVRGVSRETNEISLKMELSLEDYKKAIRAQDEVKNVRVKCRIRKKTRGWEVTKVYSFELI